MEMEEELGRLLERSPFRHRPICLLSTVFLSVTAACFFFEWTVPLALAIWAVYSLYRFIISKSLGILLPWLLLFSILAAAFVCGVYSFRRGKTLDIAALEVSCEEERTLKALVLEEYYCESFGSSYYVRLLELDGQRVCGHAVLEADQPLICEPYDVIICGAKLSKYVADAVNTGKTSALAEDVLMLCEACSDIRFTDEGRSGARYLAYLLRSYIMDGISHVLPRESASFASALLFGDLSGLTDSFSRDVAAVGISHVLAVSGQHLSVLSYIIVSAMRRARFSARRIALPTALFGLFYAWLCDSSPSVVRAALMVSLSAAVLLLGYRPDPLISLFASVLVICAVSPSSVLDIGLLLSFLATLGILLSEGAVKTAGRGENVACARRRSRRKRRRATHCARAVLTWMLSCAVTSAAATLFTVPVSVLCFGEISAVSVPFNILITPLVSLELSIGLLCAVFCRVPLLGRLLGAVFSAGHAVIRSAVELTARWVGATVSFEYPFVLPLLLICLTGYTAMRICGVRKRVMAFVPLFAFLFAYTVGAVAYGAVCSDRIEIYTVTYGSSECIAVGSGGRSLICDISDGTKTVARLSADTAKTELYAARIDGYMLTHYHLRHISSVGEVLRNNYVKAVYLPLPQSDTESDIARDIERLTERYGGGVVYYGDDGVTVGRCTVCVGRSQVSRSTHPAMYVRVETPRLTFLYLGSSVCESEQYAEWLELVGMCDCIYLGAHGPKQTYPSSLPELPGGVRIFVSAANTADSELGGITKLAFDDAGVSVNHFSVRG